jgi:hypothetical protein
LFGALEQHEPGDKIKLSIVRNPRTDAEQMMEVEVTLAAPAE